MEKKSKLAILTNGIIKENPTLVLLLGTCPFLATSSSLINALGMGLSATAVLICSNIVISMLRKVIPDKVRIPCYIVVIAGFVTLDGIGMGLGFTLALAAMGAIREFFGTGCLLGFTIIPNFSIGFFNLPPGGFFVFGVLIAIIQAATKGKALKAKGFSCGLCPMYNSCNTAEANEELEAEKAAKAAPAV